MSGNPDKHYSSTVGRNPKTQFYRVEISGEFKNLQ